MKSERNSNIELLRIIAMVLIFIGHWKEQCGYVYTGGTGLFVKLIGGAPHICAGLFFVISAWFLVEKDPGYDKAYKIWLQMLFYHIVVGITFRFFCEGSIGDFLWGFPLLGKYSLWFGRAYIIWLLFVPVLKKMCEALTDRQLQYFVILLMFFFCLEPSFHNIQDGRLLTIVWPCVVYITVYYIKKNKYSFIHTRIYKRISGWLFILAAILIYLAITIPQGLTGNSVIELALTEFTLDIKSAPSFIICLLLTMGTVKIKPINNKLINWISSLAFGVYLIHQEGGPRGNLWNRVYMSKIVENGGIPEIAAYLIIIIIITFAAAFVLESIRKILFKFFGRLKLFSAIHRGLRQVAGWFRTE